MQENKEEILIVKFLSGNASPSEQEQLQQWLKQNPANQARFNASLQVWETSAALKKKNREVDVDQAWQEFRTITAAPQESRLRKRNYTWLKVAAAFALFVVTTAVIKVFSTGSGPEVPVVAELPLPPPLPLEDVQDLREDLPVPEAVMPDSLTEEAPEEMTPVRKNKPRRKRSSPSMAERALVTVHTGDSAEIFQLPDQSIVYLNARSRLEYPRHFNKNSRYVFLVGEAYFEVPGDSGQFVVSCENTVVRGRKATFNVKSHASDRQVEVIVASGHVEFSGVGYKDVKKLVLNQGDSGLYDKQKSTISKSRQQRQDYKWWQSTSLRAKIKEFFDKLMGRKP
jgi:ferric-dicitrate binding protein FerR (iron transport regulator)